MLFFKTFKGLTIKANIMQNFLMKFVQNRLVVFHILQHISTVRVWEKQNIGACATGFKSGNEGIKERTFETMTARSIDVLYQLIPGHTQDNWMITNYCQTSILRNISRFCSLKTFYGQTTWRPRKFGAANFSRHI